MTLFDCIFRDPRTIKPEDISMGTHTNSFVHIFLISHDVSRRLTGAHAVITKTQVPTPSPASTTLPD